MISRKKIISKSEDSSSSTSSSSSSSSDNLYKDDPYNIHDDPYSADIDEDDENVWINMDQLVEDQLEEIRNKWNQIDDEIWAKIICFERNRRVAKAYARSQVISITGSDRGFDGYRIGLNGFPNPKRDYEVKIIKQQIRSGLKLKIDDLGNIHIKRVGRCSIYCGPIQQQDLHHHNDHDSEHDEEEGEDDGPTTTAKWTALEFNKPRIIFDFKKFQNSMLTLLSPKCNNNQSSSSSSSYPIINSNDPLHTLEYQCVQCIQLVVDEQSPHLLRHPCWILLINIVALDLFWSKFKRDYHHSSIITRKLPITTTNNIQMMNINLRRLKSKNPLYDRSVEDYQDDNHDLYYCGYMAKISNCSRIPVSAVENESKIVPSMPKFKSKFSERKDIDNINNNINQQTKVKSTRDNRYIRPNPMKQLPSFNRIGLEQSKRLFFSTHQLTFGSNDDELQQQENMVETETELTKHHKFKQQQHSTRYLSNRTQNNVNTISCYNQNNFKYSNHSNSKLNHKMKQTYRSTSDLVIH